MIRLQDFDYCTKLTAEHPILTDHRVHGERILPGVTFIDMILQVLSSEGIALESIQLERMLFRTPICLAPGQECDLRVRHVASEARIYVETRLQSDWVEHCRCQVSDADFPAVPAQNIQQLKAQAHTQKNLDVVYEKAKRLDINHGPYMQGEGMAYVGDDYVLADIHLSATAQPSAVDHVAHPALMDSATVVPFAAGIVGMDSDNPFIPIAIEKVNLRAPLNNRVLVLAKISSDGKADADVLHNDILLLADSGEIIGRLQRLTAKCIRMAASITGLQQPAQQKTEQEVGKVTKNIAVESSLNTMDWLKTLVAKKISQTASSLDIHQGFYELGLDSSALLDLVAQLEKQLACTLYPTLLFEHNTLAALADYLEENNIRPAVQTVPIVSAQFVKPKFVKQTATVEAAIPETKVESLVDFVSRIVGDALQSSARLDQHKGFYELGLDSNQLLSLSNRLEKELATSLYPTLLFEYNTISALADYLEGQNLAPVKPSIAAPVVEKNNEDNSLADLNTETAVVETTVLETAAVDAAAVDAGVVAAELKPAELAIWQSTWQASPLQAGSDSAKNWLLVGDMHNSRSLDYLLQTKSKLYYFKDELDSEDDELPQRFADQVELCVRDQDFAGVIWLVPGWEHQYHLQTAVMIAQALAKTGKQLAIYALVHERNIAATALAGFWRSLRQEMSRLQVRQIMSQSLAAYEWLAEFSVLPQGFELVRYHQSRREQEQLDRAPLDLAAVSLSAEPAIKSGAVVISGGFGGIALHIVDHLIARGWRQFALLGRSQPKAEITQRLESWRNQGVEILAVAADVSNKQEMTKAWRKIKNRFAQVGGIVHSAGVLRDGLVKDKTQAQLQQVLAPKTTGAALLDKLSAGEKLEFFLCFGSISGVLGNLGQSDYAYANAALAAFCTERQLQVSRGERKGRSLTIHWPLWRDGGMALSEERSNQLAALTGLQQISTRDALQALDVLLNATTLEHAAYLPVVGDMTRFRQHLQQLGMVSKAVAPQPAKSATAALPVAPESSPVAVSASVTSAPIAARMTEYVSDTNEPIAIIGLAGVYPAADSINSFWENLTGGVDAIGEIPTSRWDNAAYFDEKRELGKIYSRWGGFLEHADHFDAEFFGITPKEAELMDPQERLFLQVAWHTLEDAGLPVSRLGKAAVGVFVGAMWGQYQLLGLEAGSKQTASMFSAIANRVSYSFNLTGPSLAIDTMCSSSLTALHLAIESIRRGDCTMALVGGVNVMSHAHKYQYLCQNQMLSEDGRCRTFGAGGSGYVPGEGVGAVLLKPLSQAERDGDNIHAVIRGSALNHGGRAAGMTVPNPAAQAKVITAALTNAGLEANRVGVIEAHGTGTLLGDPIELIGLNKVFGQNKQAVSIGSVKSNIGHLESAAGIAALSKVVLQLKHRQLVPSLHSQVLNPKLTIEGTPFVVQQTLAPWESPKSRIAGISAFGAGGSNAHVLLEEYQRSVPDDLGQMPVVIPISARNPEALVRYASRWLEYLRGADALAADARLIDIAWTAQTGRDPMNERLALVCSNRDQAIAQLEAFLAGKTVSGLVIAGATTDASETSRLAVAFVDGEAVSWPTVAGAMRVSIPAYPFAPTAYWYSRKTTAPLVQVRATGSHPLLQEVIPSMEGARFGAELTADQPLLAQHLINGKHLLPGAAMLVAMVDGARKLGLSDSLHISQLTFARALEVAEEPVQLRTCFYPANSEGTEVLAELLSGQGEKIHAQARIANVSTPDALDAASLPPADLALEDAAGFYQQFEARGFNYGKDFQQITGFTRTGDTEAWAKLREAQSVNQATCAVQVIDAALQASVLLQGDITKDQQAFLPYQLEGIATASDLGTAAWVQVRSLATAAPNERAFALDIYTADGQRLWQCERFSLRAASGATLPTALPDAAQSPAPEAAKGPAKEQVLAAIVDHLTQLLSTHTGLDRKAVSKASSFDQVGIDSIVIMNVTRELETIAGELPKTLFFECPSVAALADYLWQQQGDAFARALGVRSKAIAQPAKATPATSAPSTSAPSTSASTTNAPVPMLKSFAKQYQGSRQHQEPLAVVGLAGRYPDAANPDELWENLKAGRDSVIEIPAHRWDIEQYYHPDKFNKHTTYCRHGGFVDKAECFDPAFFNMTPADALLADPQERLFLQTAWHALEDAGYSRRSISGKSVGVFAAVMWNQYQMYGLNEAMVGEQAAAYSIASGLANRVSYTMNIKGPSLTLDTMCSSSLTALHLAARAIWSGDCESAFVGGVNLSLHPHKYVALCTNNFLSANGRCSAFGEQADGYVPAEAVGVVYVKPLSQAEADGDHIYGVIRATALNHVGTTNGATVPSPDSQAELIRQACNQAGISPDSINYLEAHGTGTSLGDPIEIRGLEKALNTERRHPGCAIGSVKSNIGHAESAAGIVSLTKVLLQLQHGQLAPSLHATPANPNINFADLPFRINQQLCDWPRLSETALRRAGIHSFGAGGSNAHVIVEEYRDQRPASLSLDTNLLVLSARGLDQLKAGAQRLLDWIGHHPNASLTEVCYTLQLGREAFDHRFAAEVSTLDDAVAHLEALLEDQPERLGGTYYRLNHQDDISEILVGDEGKSYLENLLTNRRWSGLARLWTHGIELDWSSCYPGFVRRVNLPGYAFAEEVLMLPLGEAAALASQSGAARHHLQNLSDLYGQRYRSELHPRHAFLTHHQIEGRKLVPMAWFASLALAAGAQSAADQAWEIAELVLTQPVIVGDEPLVLDLVVEPVTASSLEVLILNQLAEGEQQIAQVRLQARRQDVELSTAELAQAPVQDTLNFYREFAEKGFNYGANYRQLVRFAATEGKAIAELAPFANNWQDVAHPGVIDAALQLTRQLTGDDGRQWLPQAMRGFWFEASSQATSLVVELVADAGDRMEFRLYWCDAAQSIVGYCNSFTLAQSGVAKSGDLFLVERRWVDEALEPAEVAGDQPLWIIEPNNHWLKPAADIPGATLIRWSDSNRQEHANLWLATPDAAGMASLAGRLPQSAAVLRVLIGDTSELAQDQAAFWCLWHLVRELVGRNLQRLELVVATANPAADTTALFSWMHALSEERPSFQLRLVQSAQPLEAGQWLGSLQHKAKFGRVTETGSFQVYGIGQAALPQADSALQLAGQTVLITGGAGGLGQVFARHLAQTHHCNLVLTGRKAADEGIKALIAELRDYGVEAVYYATTIGDTEAMARLERKITQRFGGLDGVVHAAGVSNDQYILRQDASQIAQVLQPKVAGTRQLLAMLGGLARTQAGVSSWMVGFSSVSGFFGNAGQADYSFANAVMDAELQANQGEIRCLTINWPLWDGVGMQLSRDMVSMMRKATGMSPLPVSLGLEVFDQALAAGVTQVLPLYGDQARMHSWASTLASGLEPLAQNADVPAPSIAAQPVKPAVVAKPAVVSHAGVNAKATAVSSTGNPHSAPVAASFDMRGLVATVVARETGLQADAIDWDKGIDQYGFSSVTITALTVELQKALGELPKTLFFECRTLGELSRYLSEHHAPAVAAPVAMQSTDVSAPVAAPPAATAALGPKRDFRFGRNRDQISIVGAAGRFPQADNLQAFWQNLVEGRDCVTGVPEGRWTTGDAIPEFAKGGFIADVDKFDARFFGISTAEATAIDPQERLFLQTAWHSLEDAGIAPGSIAGRKVGVYVGAMWGQYQLQGLDAWRNGTGGITVSSFASIANRVSYALDLKGPSVALDSMCSSSLVALKMAVDALNNGEIEYALVGGVNTSLHAYKYRQLQESMFLSKAGCCKAFGADGDGYVPGEGIVCLVLTRASLAAEQGIRERARLKGMAVAHGGNGNGYYVPNPEEQAEVIREALASARIAPETISYVEAHGTGTALGDPIEVRGLQKSYFAERKFPCAIGSVKANIGHLESAAGLASICKVLLQMENDQLVPSIHSTPQNPNIDFASTGLVVQRSLESWSARTAGQPRRAGISSFGAGGTNVHLILEAVDAPASQPSADAGLFVLSARDLPALKRLVEATLAWLPAQEASLAELAAASQRRQAMEYRLAFVVDSVAALEQALTQWLANPVAEKVATTGASHEVVAGMDAAQLQQLASTWLAGGVLASKRVVAAALPPYPFSRDRYWMDASRSTSSAQAVAAMPIAPVAVQVAVPDVRNQIIATVATQLGYEPADIDLEADFNSLGLDSVQASDIAARLSKLLNSEVLPTAFYNYPNLDSFSEQLAGQYQAPAATAVVTAPVISASTNAGEQAIAIIGMSGAFAQAANLADFWSNLKAGRDCVSEVPESRWSLAEHYDPQPGTPGKTYSRRMGLMDSIGDFDPSFFGLLPEEALAMDPQQRLFLAHSYLALEDAGIRREQLDCSKTGVYAGAMTTGYRALLPDEQAYGALSMIGNHAAALPARIAYWLNLKGPSLVVDTACSSSLMAMHLACNSLLMGETSMALAGGVFVSPGAGEQIASSAAGMLSADGQCKTFADSANGIAIGEGVGVVVLKTLAQAQADGDPIYAVIRATGANQDGKTNGITAPNAISQGELVRAVLGKAGLAASDIQYVETHGTGTKLGDPVEIEGLKMALGDTHGEILLGSVKPNIGHCYAAAGVASLIKAVLAIRNGELPPSIHADELNSLIPFDKLPFSVNRELRTWPDCVQRRAGVSAFGYTGTNVHLVLEAAPVASPQTAATELPLLLPVSARKAKSLCVQAGNLADYLEANPNVSMPAFAYSLQVGRSAMDYRRCLLVADRADAISQLRALASADEKSLVRIKRRSEQPASNLGDACVTAADWSGFIDLWQAGMAWDWAGCYRGRFTRLNLPGSEFDCKTYWPEPVTSKAVRDAGAQQTVALIRPGVEPLPLKLKALNLAEFKNIA